MTIRHCSHHDDLVSYSSFYISSNISVSFRNLIFSTSQLFPSSAFKSPWILYFLLLSLHWGQFCRQFLIVIEGIKFFILCQKFLEYICYLLSISFYSIMFNRLLLLWFSLSKAYILLVNCVLICLGLLNLFSSAFLWCLRNSYFHEGLSYKTICIL